MVVMTCGARADEIGGADGNAEHERRETHARLEVNENRARNVVRVVGLVEKYVLAIVAGDRIVLQNTLTAREISRGENLSKHRESSQRPHLLMPCSAHRRFQNSVPTGQRRAGGNH